jgi:hypothetical protein
MTNLEDVTEYAESTYSPLERSRHARERAWAHLESARLTLASAEREYRTAIDTGRLDSDYENLEVIRAARVETVTAWEQVGRYIGTLVRR